MCKQTTGLHSGAAVSKHKQHTCVATICVEEIY